MQSTTENWPFRPLTKLGIGVSAGSRDINDPAPFECDVIIICQAGDGGVTASAGHETYAAVLRGGAAATGSPATGRLRAGLVAAQIALSIVLLAGTGLLVRTVDRLLDEDSGFESLRVLTARLMLADRMFIDGGAATAFVDTLLEKRR